MKADEGELLSISKIAMRCGLDRATARVRLADNGYQPASDKAKEKLYLFDAEMEAALTETKAKFDDVRIRQMTADAQIKELKLARESGALVPINDVIERVQAISSKMYKEIAILQPKRLASKLAKAKSPAEVTRIIKTDTDRIFARLRENDQEFVR